MSAKLFNSCCFSEDNPVWIPLGLSKHRLMSSTPNSSPHFSVNLIFQMALKVPFSARYCRRGMLSSATNVRSWGVSACNINSTLANSLGGGQLIGSKITMTSFSILFNNCFSQERKRGPNHSSQNFRRGNRQMWNLDKENKSLNTTVKRLKWAPDKEIKALRTKVTQEC